MDPLMPIRQRDNSIAEAGPSRVPRTLLQTACRSMVWWMTGATLALLSLTVRPPQAEAVGFPGPSPGVANGLLEAECIEFPLLWEGL